MLSNVKYHLLKMVSSILCRMPYKKYFSDRFFSGAGNYESDTETT